MELTCFFHQVNEAAMLAMLERLQFRDNGTPVSPFRLVELSHFEQALSKVKLSVSKQVCARRHATSC
jgi:ribosome biogenesis ATPase